MASQASDLKAQSESQKGLIFSNLSSYQTDPTQKDFLLPFKDLQARAQTGDCSAQVLVGLSLKYGWYDCIINKEEGNRWIELAKKQEKNSPAKICAEGLCYEMGIGGVIVKNPEKAMECYTLSAKQGYVPALWCISEMIRIEVHAKDEEIQEGYSVDSIIAKTLKDKTNTEKKELIRQLSTQGSEQGFPPSLRNLAYCYIQGYGTQKDYKEALKLAKMSAQQGVAYAKDLVGVMYSNGLGVSVDKSEARKWFKQAADQEYENAKQNLANSQCCVIM